MRKTNGQRAIDRLVKGSVPGGYHFLHLDARDIETYRKGNVLRIRRWYIEEKRQEVMAALAARFRGWRGIKIEAGPPQHFPERAGGYYTWQSGDAFAGTILAQPDARPTIWATIPFNKYWLKPFKAWLTAHQQAQDKPQKALAAAGMTRNDPPWGIQADWLEEHGFEAEANELRAYLLEEGQCVTGSTSAER